ncbi:MAG: hypothetical protein IT380_29425 [Myxococcales bacterium]|nr:hypothetical protein [Myxococcales bacterium]
MALVPPPNTHLTSFHGVFAPTPPCAPWWRCGRQDARYRALLATFAPP